MTLSSNQPYFLPYLPYWKLIADADIFLIGDDYNFIKHGWIQRNRILVGGEPFWFRLPVKDLSCHRLISETEISSDYDPSKLLRTLWVAYRHAPAFDSVYPLLEGILTFPERNICDFLEESLRRMCAFLGITTPIGRTSAYANRGLPRNERIYDYCARTGADTYLNATGGRELYSVPEFAARGLRLEFVDYTFTPYPQQGTSDFIPGLSIVDALMMAGKERVSRRVGSNKVNPGAPDGTF